MKTSSTKNSLIIGMSIVLGASLLSIGVSNAAGTTIKACAKKSGGAMRLIDSNKKCNKNERTLTWGTQRVSGATVATGAAGVTGAQGAAGVTGAQGAAGVTGAQGAAGSNGTNGAAGVSGVSYATYTTNNIGFMTDGPGPYTVSSLDNLAAGNYLVQATLSAEQMFVFGNSEVRCRFYTDYQDGNGVMVSPFSYINFDNSMNLSSSQSMSVTYALEGLSGGNYDKIDFQCYTSGILDVIVNDFIMSATKVDTLTRQ